MLCKKNITEKVECLLGYLDYFCKRDPTSAHEIPAVIKEAEEWLNTELPEALAELEEKAWKYDDLSK